MSWKNFLNKIDTSASAELELKEFPEIVNSQDLESPIVFKISSGYSDAAYYYAFSAKLNKWLFGSGEIWVKGMYEPAAWVSIVNKGTGKKYELQNWEFDYFNPDTRKNFFIAEHEIENGRGY